VILVIDSGGAATCVYDEIIDLASLGHLEISRASHVEPDEAGQWWADLHPVDGPVLGPFTLRSEALSAEHKWIEHTLCSATSRSDDQVQCHPRIHTHPKQ